MHVTGLRTSGALRLAVLATSVVAITSVAACDSDDGSPDRTDGPVVVPDGAVPSPADGAVDAPAADTAPAEPLDGGALPDAFVPDAYPPSPLAAPWEWTSVSGDADGGAVTTTKQAFAFGLPDRFYLQGNGRSGVVPGRTADELAFASQPRTGDVEIQAFVRPTGSCKEREGKFGVMLRQDLSTGSAYVAATLTGASTERVQYRQTAGAPARIAGEVDRSIDPVWMRVVRRGASVDASLSGDGDHWWTLPVAVPAWTDPYRAGFFVSSRSSSDCDAIFEHVRVRTPLPEPWQQTEIGTNDIGVAQLVGGTLVVDGAGSDIDGTHDRFFFLRQPARGDVQISARIVSFDGSTNARAGIMLRAGSVADAPMATVLLDADGSLHFLVRSDWGVASVDAVPKLTIDLPSPLRVALVRAGDQYLAYYAADGQAWQLIGMKAARPPFDQLDVGVAVAGGEAGSRARVDAVEVTAPTIGN